MRARHDQVYGGCFIFQSQVVAPRFDCFEVFRSRGPAPDRVKEILFQLSREAIFGNFIFFEATFIADPSATMAEVKLPGCAVADRACEIFFPQRFHQCRKIKAWIDLPQQFLDDLLAFVVSAFTEVPVSQVSVLV